MFREAGISTVIWANHLVRSATAAMQSVAKEIHESETLVNVEDRIVSVDEIFRLQDADEYSAAERLYLSRRAHLARARSCSPPAAARGLEAVTADRPKVMLPIAGKPLLRWLIDGFKKESINDITVVGGYRADAIDTAGIRLVVNERYAQTGELASLACAVRRARVRYRHFLRRSAVPQLRAARPGREQGAISRWSWIRSPTRRRQSHRARFRLLLARRRSRPVRHAGAARAGDQQGGSDGARATGRASGAAAGPLDRPAECEPRAALRDSKPCWRELRARPDFDTLDMPALLNALIADGAAIEVLYVHGHWRGVNDLDDLRRAVDFAHAQTPFGTRAGARLRAGA